MADTQLARAVALDLLIEQGATFRLAFIHAYATTNATGAAINKAYNLTGCTIRAQLREAYGEPVLLEASTENGGIQIPSPTTGQVVWEFSAEQTDTLDGITRAVYDLEVAFPSGDVLRVLQGKVKISPNITRG